MVKSDIVQKLCNLHPNLYRKDIKEIVDIFFENIIESLILGKNCEIRFFGSFKTKIRKARNARNPKTGEKIFINSKKIPFFKMSKQLMNKINKEIM